jgi:hypothetical protein
MRNYLKYLSDTMYFFQRKYDLTDNQLKFLIFINDERRSFTRRFIRENFYASKNFFDYKFPDLVKRDYVFVFERRGWKTNQPNQYRVTSKSRRLIDKFYNALEGVEIL